MARRSKAYASRSRRRRLPTSYHDCSQTASHSIDEDDMNHSDKVSPRKGANAEPGNRADARQCSEKSAVAWKTQIFKRIVEPTTDIDEFLHEFAPSTSRPPVKCPVDRFPGEVPAQAGQEPRMYAPLIAGLEKMVERFPKTKRPLFINHANKVMKFPFAMCDDEDHETKPDIVVSIPKLQHLAPRDRWRNVAFIFEAKGTSGDDPMRKHTLRHEETLVQLAISARNIMLAQGRLYAFTIGIYGHKARIFRFDRAGAVCSPSFDYILRPDVLYNFMWRFIHPIDKRCALLGDDPTSTLGTSNDRALVRAFAKKHDPSYKHTAEIQKAVRRITLTDDAGNERCYLVYKLLFLNSRLFSRATTVWQAVELDETGKTVGEPVVIKEAWRQFLRTSEIRHYQDMHEAVDAAAEDAALSLSHIAEFSHGDDLGLRETKQLFRDGCATSTLDDTSFFGSVDDLDEDEINKFRFPPADVFGHRTVSASCRTTAGPEHDRSHVRIVLRSVGKPITDFDSTYEMVTALRDAIIGHEEAYKAGIIHRDVSRGNVMIMKKADGSTSGFLHDFDYASSWMRFLNAASLPPGLVTWVEYAKGEYLKIIRQKKIDAGESGDISDSDESRSDNGTDPVPTRRASGKTQMETVVDPPQTPPQPSWESKAEILEKLMYEQKQRTGTIHFMAVEIHANNSRMTHEARHDLESFFWLLVWIVLRHTQHHCAEDKYQNGAWHVLFDGARMVDCQSNKETWLAAPFRPVTVLNNKPLTQLLEKFRKLCQNNMNRRNLKKRWMTHRDVIRLFDQALAKPEEWPQADKAIPWFPPTTEPGSIMGEVGSGRLRTKGTLTFTRSASQSASHHSARGPPGSPRAVAQSDDNADETGPESDIEAQVGLDDGDDGEGDKGEPTAGKGAQRRGLTRPESARPTSITMSQASESHESPPSSNAASDSNGSESVQHPSGYGLRSSKKASQELRASARSKARGMGPPPVPRHRSGASQGSSSSRLPVAGPSAHTHGSRTSKRSRTQEDEGEERAAGSSHSPKRSRTFSGQHSPKRGKESRKGKGKRRAS